MTKQVIHIPTSRLRQNMYKLTILKTNETHVLSSKGPQIQDLSFDSSFGFN